MLFVTTWMGLEGIILSNISQIESISHLYVKHKKQNKWTEEEETHKEQTVSYKREGPGGRWNGLRGLRIQTSSYEISRSWDIMFGLGNRVNNTVKKKSVEEHIPKCQQQQSFIYTKAICEVLFYNILLHINYHILMLECICPLNTTSF